jgi:hypothetical protein
VSHAQEPIKSGTGREELTRPTIRSDKPKTVYVTRIKPVYVTRNAHPTVTTGTLSVVALPNAILLIEPVKGGGEGKYHTLSRTENLFIFDNLRPGTYRIAATLDGYKPVEQQVRITANKPTGVSLKLEPILYTVKIKTNVRSGEIRYAPVESYIEAGTGQKRYRSTGETRVTAIQDYNTTLRGLSKGDYGLDIRAADTGYEDRLVSIGVPDDSNNEEINLEITLKNVRSTETFSGLTSDQWDLPAGWRVASLLLSTNGNGIAIPHRESYRYYTDFELRSDAKMQNGVAVSFVMRASPDLENYYLIRLTGANADEPYMLSGYIVKNRIREKLDAVSIAHVMSAIKQDQFFKVTVKMTGNRMDVWVTDSQKGDHIPLGGIEDNNRRFQIGAVGIYAEGKEQSQFGSFVVCAPVCPKQ